MEEAFTLNNDNLSFKNQGPQKLQPQISGTSDVFKSPKDIYSMLLKDSSDSLAEAAKQLGFALQNHIIKC